MAKGARSIGFVPNDGAKAEASANQPLPDHVVTQFFRKTRPCRYWPNCAKGDKCAWAHGDQDLRAGFDFTKSKLCAGWRDGRCRLDPSKCKFAHGPHELRQIANKPAEEEEQQVLKDIPAPPGLSEPAFEEAPAYTWPAAVQTSALNPMSSQDSISSGSHFDHFVHRWESDSGSTTDSTPGYPTYQDSPSSSPAEAPPLVAPGLYLSNNSGSNFKTYGSNSNSSSFGSSSGNNSMNNMNMNISRTTGQSVLTSESYPASLPHPPFGAHLADYPAKVEAADVPYSVSPPGSFLSAMAPEASDNELRLLLARAGLTSGTDPVWNEPSYPAPGRSVVGPRYVTLPSLN